jgi:hypothetical protein
MNARTAMKPLTNEIVEDQSKSSTRISARASIIVALIMTTGVIVAPITARYIFSDTDNTRISIATTNQENINKEFDHQVMAAKESRDRTDDPVEKELFTTFIEDVGKVKQEHKEYSDKFIEKLKGNQVAAAELERVKANNIVAKHNESLAARKFQAKLDVACGIESVKASFRRFAGPNFVCVVGKNPSGVSIRTHLGWMSVVSIETFNYKTKIPDTFKTTLPLFDISASEHMARVKKARSSSPGEEEG